MTLNGGAPSTQGTGGQASAQAAVRIDTDVLPVWETEALPEWVVYWLIPMLSAGQKWPEASESGLSKLAQAYDGLSADVTGSAPQAGAAARAIVTGWNAPATGNFVSRAQFLYGKEAGLSGVSRNAQSYSQQASNFAVETQYSKLSINVAFWVTVVAIAIALFASFFSAGTSTVIIGPYAAAARAAISRILVRLMTLGGRQLSAARLAGVTTLSGATGRAAIVRLLGTGIGRELLKELPEEMGEEFFIDWAAQRQQIKMGTREEWDWQKSQAALIGAGTGAIVGTGLAGPVSRLTRHAPGFGGRALTTGMTNMIASPAGSFVANGVVYDQWQNPFTADSLMGGFLGGAGRTGTISPFNPSVYTALAHPMTTFAAAHDAAARTDAARAAGEPPGGGPDGNPSGGGPTTGGGQPGTPAAARQPDPATPAAPAAPARAGAAGTTSSTTGRDDESRRAAATPDADPASNRRGTSSQEGGDQTTTRPEPQPDGAPDETPRPGPAAAATPAPNGTAETGEQRAPGAATTAQAPDSAAAQPENPPAQPGAAPAAPAPDGVTTQPDSPAQSSAPAGAAVGSPEASSSLTGASPAAEPMTAAARARTALLGAITADLPGAVVNPAGDLLIPSGSGVHTIPHATMTRIRTALDTRAEQVLDLTELQDEASAMLQVSRPAGPAAPVADTVPGRLDELTVLTEKWRLARSLPEKRLIAVGIDGVNRRLRQLGHIPPSPPWAPTQDVRPRQAPAVIGENPAATEVRAVIEALVRAEQALNDQIGAKRTTAKEARKEARKAIERARKELKQHDQGRFERAREARKENRAHRATEARHTRIAEAYKPALKQATQARRAYQELLSAMSEPAAPGETGTAEIAASRAVEATRQHRGYLEALAAALPQEAALSAAQPTDQLAHLTTLTTTVNNLLKRNGVGHTFTPIELEQALRADFHQLVSPDGVVLRVGRGRRAAEVRVKLTLADLVEVIDPDVKASEMMVGLFFETGRTVSATESNSGGLSAGFNTGVLAQLMPEGEWARLTELLGIGVEVAAGRNRSATGGVGGFAQGGQVSDNRSESLLFDAAATWTVEIRTRRTGGWSGTTTVDSGAPGDASSQRLWLSHGYADQPPSKVVRISADRRDPKLPNHVLSGITGMEGALDQIAAVLGGEYTEVGAVARNQLRTFVTEELPHRMRHAVDTGHEHVFTKNGEPHARVRAKTSLVLEESEPLGGATAEVFEEEVLVDFAATPGGASSGGSMEGSVSVGFNHPALKETGGFGDYHPTFGPNAKGSRSVSRSVSATANRQAIHPSVHRKTSHGQGYKVVLKTTFVVELIGKPPVKLPPVTSRALISMRESAAYRFGLPVDRAALVYSKRRRLLDAEGNQVLRGDPRSTPPPGRKAELPAWLGDGPGQMRGAGPALVQEIDGLDEVRQKVLDELAERGIVPKMVDGVPQYASNRLMRASQVLNLQEVAEQLSEHRIRAGYDPLAQDEGLEVDLMVSGLNGAPEHYIMRISLKQDFGDYQYVGHSDSETVVNLDIGSDTSALAISRSRTYAGTASASESDGPDQGHDGLSHNVGVSGGGNRTRTAGSSVGSTVNVVTLHESTGPVAIFSLAHDLTVELLHDGESTLLDSRRGTAKLLFAVDLLPPDTASAPVSLGRMSRKLQSKSRLLHMDMPGGLQAAEKVLPRGTRADSAAYQKIRTFLGVRNLVGHARVLRRPLTTNLAIRAQGTPTQSALSVAGEVGEVELLGVVDHVSGNILFGLQSAGVSWGGSSGLTVGGSVSASDLDGGGTSSDGGKLSLPSRSGGTSVSTGVLDIWGNEDLTIEFGRQYILRAPVDFTLTGSESAAHALPVAGRVPLGESSTATAQGTALFSIPEFEALLLYAQGDLTLPAALVGDAVERLLNGSLPLDPSLAVPLVQRYVATGVDATHAERHTPRALLAMLEELTGLGAAATTAQQGNTEQQLDRTLSEAADLIERSRDVVLAPSYDRATGVGAIDALHLTDEQGNDVDFEDAVLNAVRAADPQAVAESPTLREELDVDFSAEAALIRVEDMWSERGFEKSYHVHVGPQTAQAQELTVKVRLEYDDPADSRRATFITHTSQAGSIVQRYRYLDLSHSEGYNGSYSAGVDVSNTEQKDENGTGVSTDRGQGYSGSTNEQRARLQREALFNGHNLVEQGARLVIEVTTRSVRAGVVLSKARDVTRQGRPRTSPPVSYRASLVRRIPTGMIRPAAEDPGPVDIVPDPRQVELRPGHFPNRLAEIPGRPSLYTVVTAQLAKMWGRKAVAERRAELIGRLSVSALLTGFERMAGPAGSDIVPDEVTIQARTTDFTVIAGPFDAEKGEVDRKATSQNVTVSRSRVLPVSGSGTVNDGDSGLKGGARFGEQAAESVSDHRGARRERSMFVKGKAYIVRLRVDYDLTFQPVDRLRDGNSKDDGKPVHLPGASTGEVDVTLFGEEITELLARMDAGVRLAPSVDPGWPTFTFLPNQGREGLIPALQDARLAARERGAVARVAIREADGVHRYRAAPDGSVYSETADGGFADAFATLSPALLDAAHRVGVDLRHVFMNSEVPGTFAQQVMAELRTRGIVAVDLGKPVWPANREESSTPVGGSTAQGVTVGTVTSPALEDTPFSKSGRTTGSLNLTLPEVRAQSLPAGDLAGAAAHLSWSADDMLTVQLPTGDQHVRVLVEEPGEGLNSTTELRAGTPDDPHVLRIGLRVHPEVVSSVLVHEISHVAQASAATAAGAPQGVIRPSLSEGQSEGTDLCLIPRLDEHAHLSGKWRAATDQAGRERLAEAIDAIAADIERRGHPQPPPPWGTGPRAPADTRSQGRIAMLLNAMTPASAVGPEEMAGLSEAERAGLARGRAGAAPRLLALARAGELTPEQVAAIRGEATLPEAAAAAAIGRGAAVMGGRVRVYGPGLLDIMLPGRPPIPVEVRAARDGAPEPGMLTYQVDDHLTIGANERAAAAAAAEAVARALGAAPAAHAAMAELYEAVRQARAATAAQRPGRLGVLFDLTTAAGPEVWALVPRPLAAELATLASGRRPRDWPAYLAHLRVLANTTGWYPPERECRCPAGEPCVCGRRTEQQPVRAPGTPDTVQV